MVSSSAVSASASLFASLPARPPTPPRDFSRDVDDTLCFLQHGHEDCMPGSRLSRLDDSADTPPYRSPASSEPRSSTVGKRVGFSPFPTFHNIPQPGQSSSPAARIQKQTPLRQQPKPLRSILKASNEPLPPTPDDLESKLSYFSPHEPGSFPKMLQSVLSQLASQSRDDRRDAYLAINGALKHYEGIPDSKAICEKMTSLQQFIARDLAWKDVSGRLDSSIVTQALQLSSALMNNPETEMAFDDDFRTLLVERSIMVIEQNDIPKGIFKAHMYVLSQQRFKSHIIMATRADKLVTTLRGIEDRCSGNSVASARLIIYQKLIQQAPSIMLNRMRDWIEYVFHGMLSSIPDVRNRAIEACKQAGLSLGHQPPVAKVMYDLADKNGDEDQTYGEYLNIRLKEMSAEKETAKWVPRIWGAIILLFRCKRRPVEKWPCFKDWLATIQRSLNSPDLEVKHHANIAWNKLVFAVMPDGNTTETMRSMLRIPIIAGLERRGADGLSQQNRQIAMDSYCNLLHYGLRPGLTPEDLDKAWELYVDPILSKMGASDAKSKHNACCVLQGLLRRGSGVWNSNAANEPGTIKPEDLPRLEPRWVRSRFARILKLMEPIIISGMWITPDANEAANSCWRVLMQAVAEAGSQEVKTSNELKEVMAQLTNFFRHAWNGDWGSQNTVERRVWLDRYHLLLDEAVECLGAVHFVEDVLSKTSEENLEAAPTPSNRTAKHSVTAFPAFVFLFSLYYQTPIPLRTSGLDKISARRFLRLLGSAKGSITGTLALLHRALQFAAPANDSAEWTGQLWNNVADEAIEALRWDDNMSLKRDGQIMGNALRSAVNILLYGLRHASSTPSCLGKAVELYSAACRSAQNCANNGGIVLGLMEPFAKSVVDFLDELPVSTISSIGAAFLKNGVWVKTRQELDSSRKTLWTVSLELPRNPVFDPFDHLYTFLQANLTREYERLLTIDSTGCQILFELMKSIISFLQRCPPGILATAFSKVQHGLLLWVQDPHRIIFPLSRSNFDQRYSDLNESVAHETLKLWSALILLLEGIPRHDTPLLYSLEPLLTAAYSSPSRDIVNQTIIFWNATFGQETHLQYPLHFQSVLRARRAQADLALPEFPEDVKDSEVATLPRFAESQSDNLSHEEEASQLHVKHTTLGSARKQRKDAPVEIISCKEQESSYNELTPRSRQGGSLSGLMPRARLRHDDSQIDFAPIEHSLPSRSTDAGESQLLTDHQREVMARQHGDAQMFPGLSSSPTALSKPENKSIAKKLDFASDTASEPGAVMTTPIGGVEGNLMSDDLPSSPTPRGIATERMISQATQYGDDDEETICDPPSSPPQENGDHCNDQVQVDVDDQDDNIGETEEEYLNVLSDVPSDSFLPTAQLEREAAAAEKEIEISKASARPVHDVMAVELSQAASPEQARPKAHQTPSRIEDSMRQMGSKRTDTSASLESQGSQVRVQRKRKRSSEVVHAAKKRTKPSPLTFWNRLGGSQRYAENDDIEEEIVVASSQRMRSPTPVENEIDPVSEESLPDSPTKSSAAIEHKPEASAPGVPVKRAQWRSRRSDSHPSSQNRPFAPCGLKRNASVLSTTSAIDQPGTNVVGETPALPRTRKSARLSQEATGATSSSRRKVAIVVVSPLSRAGLPTRPEVEPAEDDDVAKDDEMVQNTAASPGQQASEEQLSDSQERRIARPKSILCRLRSVLADCKKMVFGSQAEEREFDDVLFDIRREVHEAGRRARDQ